MSAPSYTPEQIDALARVLAEAALNELMHEMAVDSESSVSEFTKTNAATPGQEMCGVPRGFDERESNRIQS
jgi:hypothetical protein